MFRQFNNRVNPESGMVLATVLMIVSVIMVLSIAILSLSLTQSTTSQQQIEDIRSDQLAKGIFWNTYSACFNTVGCAGFTPGATPALGTENGKPYSGVITAEGGTKYKVQINY